MFKATTFYENEISTFTSLDDLYEYVGSIDTFDIFFDYHRVLNTMDNQTIRDKIPDTVVICSFVGYKNVTLFDSTCDSVKNIVQDTHRLGIVYGSSIRYTCKNEIKSKLSSICDVIYQIDDGVYHFSSTATHKMILYNSRIPHTINSEFFDSWVDILSEKSKKRRCIPLLLSLRYMDNFVMLENDVTFDELLEIIIE